MKNFRSLILILFIATTLNVSAQNTATIEGLINLMSKETNPKKNEAHLRKALKRLKTDSINHTENIDVMKGIVALTFLKKENFSKFNTYINQIQNKFNQTSYMNMGSMIVFNELKNIEFAEELAKKTVELYDSYKTDSLSRPTFFDKADWARFMKMAAYPYYEAYATLLHAVGKNRMALFYEEKALEDQETEYIMQSSSELYAVLLEINSQEEKAYNIVLKAAQLGRSSEKMNAQLKRLYFKKTGKNADDFMATIHKNVQIAYKKEIATKMVTDYDAYNFTLKDLNGKLVSLSDFRGKIVVLDFWATWCVPCIQSMPAMDKLRKQNPEVVFLFIATQENGTGAEDRVKSFVKKHNYTFDVLMDEQNKENPKIFTALLNYKIKGIPAKVVIDKNGKLRFSSEGYSTDTHLINELEAMIAIAKEQ